MQQHSTHSRERYARLSPTQRKSNTSTKIKINTSFSYCETALSLSSVIKSISPYRCSPVRGGPFTVQCTKDKCYNGEYSLVDSSPQIDFNF